MATFDEIIVTDFLDVRGNTKLGNATVDITTVTGTLNVGKDVSITGVLTANGNTTLGNATSDTVTASGSMTVGVDLSVNGNTTLGDQATDTVTMNSLVAGIAGNVRIQTGFNLAVLGQGNGIILKGSPNGNCYLLTIDDTVPATPVITLTPVGCPT